MAELTNEIRKAKPKHLLDEIDHRILDELSKDARCSNKELAARVGLAPSSCLLRVRRLIRERRVLGFHADIDPEVRGVGLQAMLIVRFDKHSTGNYTEFRRYVGELREVVALYHLAGSEDFLLHVMMRDVDHLRRFVIEKVASRPEVGRMETSLIFEFQRRSELPFYETD